MRYPRDKTARIERDGFIFPIDILSETEAEEYFEDVVEWKELAARIGGDIKSRWNYPKIHLLTEWADALVHHPIFLGVAAEIIGPNLMIWSTNVFHRPPGSGQELAWHQDAPYFGWENSQGRAVRFWIALTSTTRDNGTMRFLPGYHGELLTHAFSSKKPADVMRGEEVQVDLDDSSAVDVVLEPGQASIHLPTMVHSSGQNHTGRHRLCVAIDVISPELKPLGPDSALLVKGEDYWKHFIPEKRVGTPLSQEAVQEFRIASSRRDQLILSEYKRKALSG